MNFNLLKNKEINKYKLNFILTIFVIALKYYLFLVFKTNLDTNVPRLLNLAVNGIYALSLLGLVFNLKTDLKDKVLIGIGLIIAALSKNENLLIFFMLGVYAKNNKIKVREIILYYTIINLILFMSIFLLNLIDVIPDGLDIHFRNGVARKDFGFGNPNVPFLCLVSIIAGYIYLRFKKYSIIDRVVIICVLAYVYFNTYSRTGLLALAITLIMIEIIKLIKIDTIKNNKIVNVLTSHIFTIVFSGSVFVALFLNQYKFNKILSSRPEYWNFYIKRLGFFGTNSASGASYPIDNTYIYLISVFGVVSGLFIIYVAFVANRNIINEGNKNLYCVVVMFTIYGFGENVILNKALSPLLIILTMYFLDDFAKIVNSTFTKVRSRINERKS